MKDQAKLRKILEYKSIAVVGFSPREERPSNYVSMYMQKNGYLITPVNPGHQHIGNLKCYPSLESIDHPIDIVNIFRKSEFVYDIVKSSIFINAKAVWMQDSVYDKRAERLAIEKGIMVVMDDCILRQHKILKEKVNINSDLKKRYERDGYAVVKNVVDKEIADEIKSHINWLVKKYPDTRPEAFHHDMLIRDPFIHHLLHQKKF